MAETTKENIMDLTKAQLKYLNGTALQELMKLDDDYCETRKREIYHKTINSLQLYTTEEYWRLKGVRVGGSRYDT
jgi:hypothetical protein